MLKLEKNLRNEVKITFRKREGLFTLDLVKAFFFALFIHAGGLLFFHIKPFKLGYDQILFPPTTVTSEIEPGEFSALANLSSEEGASHRLEPKLNSLQFPELPSLYRPSRSNLFLELSLAKFDQVERRYTAQINPQKGVESRYPLYRLAGPLAERHILFAPVLEMEADIPLSVQFSVLVDHQGKIFWHNVKLSSGNKKADSLAERAIASLVLDTSESRITKGIIEITITPKRNNDPYF